MSGNPMLMTRPIFGDSEVAAAFGDAAFVGAMVRVEVALARAEAALGVIPGEAAEAIAGLGTDIHPDDLEASVRSSGVPVPGLVKALRARLDPAAADWVHWGATSQDIVDTAFCLCQRAALDVIETRLGALIDALRDRSLGYRDTPMLARTRGQLATPITFGLRVAQWAQPLIALETEVRGVREAALRAQFGGASGSRSAVGEAGGAIARGLAAELGLAAGPPWHTDRSGVRRLASWLARLVAALAKIGRDIAIGSRGEVAEVRAGAGGGSSTMPHKSNPVTAEALQSVAAVAVACEAGLAASAVHAEERDGAMWPVEWALLPQLFEVAGAALGHAATLAASLEARDGTMRDRIAAVPDVMAEAAVFALSEKVGRAEASRIVGEALAGTMPLFEALGDHPGVDWGVVRGLAAEISAASEVAEEIFAARRT